MLKRPRDDPFEMGTLGRYRNFAIRAARDLLYGEEVEQKIRDAQSINEIIKIMATAREAME